jgi:hypothetical protein
MIEQEKIIASAKSLMEIKGEKMTKDGLKKLE